MTAALQRLYDKIPTFTCRKGCGDCCGLVPWSEEEFAAVADRLPSDARVERISDVIIPMRHGSATCPFFDNGCTVYEDRPFMCRLFGTARDARLTCPHGCQPKPPLTVAKARRLTDQYREVTTAGLDTGDLVAVIERAMA